MISGTASQRLKNALSDKRNKDKLRNTSITYNTYVAFIKENFSQDKLIKRLFKWRQDLVSDYYERILLDQSIDLNIRQKLRDIANRRYAIKLKRTPISGEDCCICMLIMIVGIICGAILAMVTLHCVHTMNSRPETIQYMQRTIMERDYRINVDGEKDRHSFVKYDINIDYPASMQQALEEHDYVMIGKILNMTSVINANDVFANATRSNLLTPELLDVLILAGVDFKSDCLKKVLLVMDNHCDWNFDEKYYIPLPELLACSAQHQLALNCVVKRVTIDDWLDSREAYLEATNNIVQRHMINAKIRKCIYDWFLSQTYLLYWIAGLGILGSLVRRLWLNR